MSIAQFAKLLQNISSVGENATPVYGDILEVYYKGEWHEAKTRFIDLMGNITRLNVKITNGDRRGEIGYVSTWYKKGCRPLQLSLLDDGEA